MTEQIQDTWTAENILQYLEAHREQLKALGVVQLGLFGSYARGEQTTDSDLDFIVEMESTSFKNYMTLWHFLEDSFEMSVDLGEQHLIRDEIRPQVLRDVRYVKGL
ncbi:MAG: nucleotidyltransferase domain-containing protein [Chloroflexota bacterium]